MSAKSMSSIPEAPMPLLKSRAAFGAKLVQFHYQGGWPKKRQWAMENLPLEFDWIFLVDADEALTPELEEEIRRAIKDPTINGYFISLRMYFLGRLLRHGGAGFWKLSLFRRGKGGYECRLKDQDPSMADMEIHEHVVVEGATARLKNPLAHRNVESLSRYIQKHDEYSNWEAKVWLESEANGQLAPSFFGTQAQRRRWLKTKFLGIPGAPLWFFLVQVSVQPGISGRRARLDLLRIPGSPDVSCEVEDLRVATGKRG